MMNVPDAINTVESKATLEWWAVQ